MIDRKWIANKFIRGGGIELGAFHNPWPYDSILAQVKYCDKADTKTVLQRHPDLPFDLKCVTPDFVDDAETLATVPDNRYNFVIASHVIEHCFSPLTAIENHLRVLMTGGHAIYALPDKRHTFDKNRENSTCMVDDFILVSDYPELVEQNKINHHHDYLEHVDGIQDSEERVRIAKQRLSEGKDIHYHAWDSQFIYKLFHIANHVDHRFEVVLFYPAGHEVFIVLKKL